MATGASAMDVDQLRKLLDDQNAAEGRLDGWGLTNTRRGHANLVNIATGNVPLDLLSELCNHLERLLPGCPNPDMALNNLDRFLAGARNRLGLLSLFERDPEALTILVQIFSTSQYFSDLLIADHETFELLRLTQGQPVSREALVQELVTEVMALSTPHGVTTALRRFKRRETLRIGYGDIVRNLPLEITTKQISYLADAVVEAAVVAARFELEQRYGTPMRSDGKPAEFVVLALGKLGGNELNYSSDIDLMFLYDLDGQTTPPRRMTNNEFFGRLGKQIVKLLGDVTELGQAYRVDMRLRPEGSRGLLAMSLDAAKGYYDTLGRTWERQAFIKARAIAGSLKLGQEFLQWMEPWIYRRYLQLADIKGIQALKRRIEQRTSKEGGDENNVKTGRGGIRDVEFVIQFLQLLNAGDLPQLRTGNTLTALASLEEARILTYQERSMLEANYRFLRNIEHRLQFMFDLQTHQIPDSNTERRGLAIRLGYKDDQTQTALEQFQRDYRQAKNVNRKILDHLLHDAFPEDAELDPEADLVLDPDPDQEKIQEVLGRYPFRDIPAAYRYLMDLATEPIRFLYPRRCRLFLATIAKRLLADVSAMPDPDQTLANLARVSGSLGGKVVLWELFRYNPSTLLLYVRLCSYSPLVSDMLVGNPGMVDELMDSLVLNRLPSRRELSAEIQELLRAAEDPNPILHSFKNSHVLTAGVREILGREPIENTTRALSDLAEVCLEQIIAQELEKLTAKFGEPRLLASPAEEDTQADQPQKPQDLGPCRFIVLAMGKFGGQELSFGSDLDVVFLYEGEGHTAPRNNGRGPGRSSRISATTTSNQHFFSELAQRIVKAASQLGPYGRLYEVDMRLRPTGRSGVMVTSVSGFERYFMTGQGQLWERQALCKARVLWCPEDLASQVQKVVNQIIYDPPWSPEDAESIRSMRLRLQETTSPDNLKRGPGGIVDIEFLAQMLQMRHGGSDTSVRQSNTLKALESLHQAGYLSNKDAQLLAENYRFLRKLEARLRLSTPNTKDDLPEDNLGRETLAQQLGYSTSKHLLGQCAKVTHQTRERFDDLFKQAIALATDSPSPEAAAQANSSRANSPRANSSRANSPRANSSQDD